jgi:hypothetical protein
MSGPDYRNDEEAAVSYPTKLMSYDTTCNKYIMYQRPNLEPVLYGALEESLYQSTIDFAISASALGISEHEQHFC